MRQAIVTGCSRGIGAGVTAMLLDEGYRVFGISRTFPEQGRDWPRDGFTWLRCDLGAHKPWPLQQLARQLDSLDVLVHCAAVQGPVGNLEDCDPDAWAETIRVNLLGTASVLRAFLPLLHTSEDARILLFSGGGAFNAREFHTAYAASKAGVVAIMESLSDELHLSTVTVNAVAPGYVPSGMPNAWASEKRDEALEGAVACVKHLLSPHAYGLSGRTISAQFDDWQHLAQSNVAKVNASMMGRRERRSIALSGRMAVAV